MRTLLALMVLFSNPGVVVADWTQLPSMPDKEGFAGSYAGVSNGALLVAGGANFPDKKPWEGGTKVWYDTVFVLESKDAEWKVAGHLQRPLGYGVSVTCNNGLVCAGGSDRERHYADVFRLEWSNGKLTRTALPALPRPLANCSGALVGDVLYVAGGTETPDATKTSSGIWALDLSLKSPRWSEIVTWPGKPRMLAAAAGSQGKFWLMSGVDLTAGSDGKPVRHYLSDAYSYDPKQGRWKRIADLPHSEVAAPSPAPFDQGYMYLLGGDDGSQVTAPQEKHPGFGKTALRYDVAADRWSEAGAIPAPRAVLPTAFWHGRWVLSGGEQRPGVRSPEMWSWAPGTKD